MRSTHIISFNTGRRLFHGRPRQSFRRFGLGINRLRTFHWSSLRSRAVRRICSLMRRPAPAAIFDRAALLIGSDDTSICPYQSDEPITSVCPSLERNHEIPQPTCAARVPPFS